MSNSTATLKLTQTYTNPQGQAVAPAPLSVACPYQAQLEGTIDVPDTTAASTELDIPFGSIAAATLVVVHNRLTQDIGIKVNGKPASATGTLVAGTKSVTLANAAGDLLSVKAGAANGGTPGNLHVRRSNDTTVIVESYTNDGIQDLDVSDFTVYVNGGPVTHRVAPGGVWATAMPVAAGGSPVASMKVVLTAEQAGAGKVAFHVFGDPV